MRKGRAVLVMSMVTVLAAPAAAQTVWAVISGMVVDSTDLPVPGATVSLVNQNTGDKRSTTTSPTGDLVFPGLLPGTYTITIQKQGFKRFEKSNINLTASERLSVGQVTLEIGAVTESVTVTAQGTPVQTTSNERSGVLTSNQLHALPSMGWNYLSMIRTLPGVGAITDSNDRSMRGSMPSIKGSACLRGMRAQTGNPGNMGGKL